MSDSQTEAEALARNVAARVNVTLSPIEVAAAAKLVLGVIELATGQALKRAERAGMDAAAAVTTVEQANAVLEAAAAAQESK